MKSISWNEIQQIFEEWLGQQIDPIGINAMLTGGVHRNLKGGVHYVLQLIPLLKESEILAGAERNLGHLLIQFYTPSHKSMAAIAAPHVTMSGSDTEFRVYMYRLDENEERFPRFQTLDQKLISVTSLDEVVRTAENFFLQLLKDEDIISRKS